MSDGFKSFLNDPANHIYWLASITVLIATGSLLRRVLIHKPYPAFQPATNDPTTTYIPPTVVNALINFLPRLSLRKESTQVIPEPSTSDSTLSSSKMRFHRHRRRRSRGKKQQKTVEEIAETESIEPLHPRQPYDAFLVLDIEGTCKLGTDFNYPNEIIVRFLSQLCRSHWLK